MVINGALPNSLRKIVKCEVRGYATKWNRGHKVQITERLKAKQSNKLHCDKEGRRDRGRRDGQGSAELPTHEHYAARVTEGRGLTSFVTAAQAEGEIQGDGGAVPTTFP